MIRMEPTITVGIIDRAEAVTGAFRETVSANGLDFPAGPFQAVADGENVALSGEGSGARIVAAASAAGFPAVPPSFSGT